MQRFYPLGQPAAQTCGRQHATRHRELIMAGVMPKRRFEFRGLPKALAIA